MLELTREAALRAASARTIRRLAEQAVPEPEGEPLLADPRGSLQQDARRERPLIGERGEACLHRLMAIERDEGH